MGCAVGTIRTFEILAFKLKIGLADHNFLIVNGIIAVPFYGAPGNLPFSVYEGILKHVVRLLCSNILDSLQSPRHQSAQSYQLVMLLRF
jgi:hypothetical protein